MGLTYAEITMVNGVEDGMAQRGIMKHEDVRQMTVSALVDSGANMLIISQAIADQLGLMIVESTNVELADGSISKCSIVGSVSIRFKNRKATSSALVLPGASEVLLGVIPMEAMDVIIDPISQRLDVHPDRPDRAGFKAK
jgi:clan AA aspartic protease